MSVSRQNTKNKAREALKEKEQKIIQESRQSSRHMMAKFPAFIGFGLLALIYHFLMVIGTMMGMVVTVNVVTVMTRSVTTEAVEQMSVGWFLNLAFLPGLCVTLVLAGMYLMLVRYVWSRAYRHLWLPLQRKYRARFFTTSISAEGE